jgi:hypothetical protein
MAPEKHRRDPGVVDLVAIAQACAPIVTWYDGFLAGAERALTPQALARLNQDLTHLRSLPCCGGQLGRAIAVVASGAAAAGSDRTMAALEVLRTTLAVGSADNHQSVSPPRSPTVTDAPLQPALPGFDLDDTTDPAASGPPSSPGAVPTVGGT